MKTLRKNELENIVGGSAPSTRTCALLGAFTLGAALGGQLTLAGGALLTAIGAGCFDA